MRAPALVALLFVLAADSNTVRSQEEKKETDKLQGVWEVTTLARTGVEKPDFVKNRSPKFVLNGEKYTWKAGTASEDGTFKLGSKGKLNTVDLTITDGEDKGKYQLGIYEVDGDKLKLCFAPVGAAERPTAFASKADAPEDTLIILKRQKKE